MKLDDGRVMKLARKALQAGAVVLRDETQRQLLDLPNGAAFDSAVAHPGWGTSPVDGVRIGRDKFADAGYFVHIMGDPRLWCTENGSQPGRTTRKGMNRGQMPAAHFFASAVETVQGRMASRIAEVFSREIDKWNRE